jgi:hypothetical protein
MTKEPTIHDCSNCGSTDCSDATRNAFDGKPCLKWHARPTLTPADALVLYSEANKLHESNLAAAHKTAENAIRLGIVLHQIKELVGHGEFGPALTEHCPAITDRCARNYMRLAEERLIEEKARLLIPETTHSGKSETVSDLNPADPQPTPVSAANAIPSSAYEAAVKEVEAMSWIAFPAKTQESLCTGLGGKDLMALYREYGIVRAKEPKVYHPPKQLTVDEKLDAEKGEAAARRGALLNEITLLELEINSAIANPVMTHTTPAEWRELLRRTRAFSKLIKPLTQRKASPAEKWAIAKKKSVGRPRKAAAKPTFEPCDHCGGTSMPIFRCTECAHYFCDLCMEDHGCGVKFKCAEQLEAEAAQAKPADQDSVARALSPKQVQAISQAAAARFARTQHA